MIELKINVYSDREKLIVALVNSGYMVRVETRERNDSNSFMPVKDNFVIIEEKKNSIDIKKELEEITSDGISAHKCPYIDHACFCTGECMGLKSTNAPKAYRYDSVY